MKRQISNISLIMMLFFSPYLGLKAKSLHSLKSYQLIERQYIDQAHAEAFAHLQVNFRGRIKPTHTLALDLLRKIYKKDSYRYVDTLGIKQQLSAEQVLLGIYTNPSVWQMLPIIKIDSKALPKLGNLLEVNALGYAKPVKFLNFNRQYILKQWVEEAYLKGPAKRTAFDKAIMNIDERFNIVRDMMEGNFLGIYPIKKHPNGNWAIPSNAKGLAQDIQKRYREAVLESIGSKDWNKPTSIVEEIALYQKENAGKELLNMEKIAQEISYNKAKPFFICLMVYTVLGGVLLVLNFLFLFFSKKWVKLLIHIVTGLGILIFLYHGYGIGLRWYISGHAPWSNGYEATIFISWVGVLASLLFLKKSTYPLAAMELISVCLLGIAHGNLMSPEITNLVPVLKSYWLMIHVAIITGSYGFLALGSVLSILVFMLMCLSTKNNQANVYKDIIQLTAINQVTSTIGLFMLTIGTFLGGVWANESWGRYWGWDPKETWALISIIVYSFVLHLRIMIPPKKFTFTYNVLSLFALFSLIMTFFGVNYYLAGLHSYAKGDSFPIPQWIYVVLGLLVVLVSFAYYKYKENYSKESVNSSTKSTL